MSDEEVFSPDHEFGGTVKDRRGIFREFQALPLPAAHSSRQPYRFLFFSV